MTTPLADRKQRLQQLLEGHERPLRSCDHQVGLGPQFIQRAWKLGLEGVAVTDTTLSGGSVALHDGSGGNNTVSAAGDTAASKGKTLYYVTGVGPDSFTGGFENDTVYVSAAAVADDTLTGGSGKNVLVLTSAGTFSLDEVRDFSTIYLAAGANTVTVTDTTLSGGSATVHGGSSGNNSISVAGDTAASKGKTLYYLPGIGIDSFAGGFENDTIRIAAGSALGGDTLTGGTGSNAVVMTSAGHGRSRRSQQVRQCLSGEREQYGDVDRRYSVR